jgi:hypothetical protein
MTNGYGYYPGIGSMVLDIDDDGFEDLVGVGSGFNGIIRVWFGPLTDPSLTTPHTGDTGAPGDTGASNHTADTGSPIDDTGATPPASTGDTGAPSPRKPKEEEPAAVCGCAHSSPAAVALLVPLVALRRRPRRQGAP